MFQVYFEYIKNLVMKYTSSIVWKRYWKVFVFLFWVKGILEVDFQNLYILISIYMFQVYFEYIKNLVMKYTSNIVWTRYWKAFVFVSWVRGILEVDFQNLYILISICIFQVYFEYIKNLIMKYTSSILWTCFWNTFVFLFWVRTILEIDFLHLQIYIQS